MKVDLARRDDDCFYDYVSRKNCNPIPGRPTSFLDGLFSPLASPGTILKTTLAVVFYG
jgi:hypothetical protein